MEAKWELFGLYILYENHFSGYPLTIHSCIPVNFHMPSTLTCAINFKLKVKNIQFSMAIDHSNPCDTSTYSKLAKYTEKGVCRAWILTCRPRVYTDKATQCNSPKTIIFKEMNELPWARFKPITLCILYRYSKQTKYMYIPVGNNCCRSANALWQLSLSLPNVAIQYSAYATTPQDGAGCEEMR